MSWDDTHRRWRAMREADAVLLATGRLPWHPDWAPLFGDRAGLVAALRHRLTQRLQAQLDPALGEPALAERWEGLAAARWALDRLDDLDRLEDGGDPAGREDPRHGTYALAG